MMDRRENPAVGISPNIKQNNPQDMSQEWDNSYISRKDRVYYDTQRTSYDNTKKTKKELGEIYTSIEQGQIDTTPDVKKRIQELNYQLFCQSLWTSNVGRGEYNRFR